MRRMRVFNVHWNKKSPNRNRLPSHARATGVTSTPVVRPCNRCHECTCRTPVQQVSRVHLLYASATGITSTPVVCPCNRCREYICCTPVQQVSRVYLSYARAIGVTSTPVVRPCNRCHADTCTAQPIEQQHRYLYTFMSHNSAGNVSTSKLHTQACAETKSNTGAEHIYRYIEHGIHRCTFEGTDRRFKHNSTCTLVCNQQRAHKHIHTYMLSRR